MEIQSDIIFLVAWICTTVLYSISLRIWRFSETVKYYKNVMNLDD